LISENLKVQPNGLVSNTEIALDNMDVSIELTALNFNNTQQPTFQFYLVEDYQLDTESEPISSSTLITIIFTLIAISCVLTIALYFVFRRKSARESKEQLTETE
jgi:hypothetical protein